MKKNLTNFIIDITTQDLLKQKQIVLNNEQYTKKDLKRFSTATKEELELIFETNSNLLFFANDGMSALHYATLNPRIDVLEYALNLYKKHNYNLNVATKASKEVLTGLCYLEGETALDFAISLDSIDKFNLLIHAGVNEVAKRNGPHTMNEKNQNKEFNYDHYIRDIRYIGSTQNSSVAKQYENFMTIDINTIFTTLFLKKAHKIFNNISMSGSARLQFEKDFMDYANSNEKSPTEHGETQFRINKTKVIALFDYKNHVNLINPALDSLFISTLSSSHNHREYVVPMLLNQFLNQNKIIIEQDKVKLEKSIKLLKETIKQHEKNYYFRENNTVEQLKSLEENFTLHLEMTKNNKKNETKEALSNKKMKI